MKATITAAASTYVCALVAMVAVPRCRRLLILTHSVASKAAGKSAPTGLTKLAPRAGRGGSPGSFRRRVGFFAECKFLGVSEPRAVVASDAAAQQQQPPPHEQA